MSVRNNVFILSLKQQVIFPAIRSSIPLSPKVFSHLCEFCEKHESTDIGVVTTKASAKGTDEIQSIGTFCRITSHAHSTTKMADKEITVVTLTVEGQSRFEVQKLIQSSPFHVADIKLIPTGLEIAAGPSLQIQALMQSVQSSILQMLKESAQSGAIPSALLQNLSGGGPRNRRQPSPSVFADTVAAGLQQLTIAEKQQVLETFNVQERLELVLELVRKVSEVQRLSKEINSKMQKRTEDELRETVLRRQLNDLQRELRKLKHGSKGGDSDDGSGDEGDDDDQDEDEITLLRQSLKKAQLSPDAQKIANNELKRLQNIQPHHPEYTVCRTYLETLASLPWADSTTEDLDLHAAHEILERDHYGLQKVKRRILEFLAVQKLRKDMKGPILCLHGPPGVGKTSLGRSVARALGRKFHRVALGGVRDEAELRGHRRTYIGSMTGVIIQALIAMKVNNPVILLDEIDKLTRNAMFNPSGAMLELLDPEQNHTFKDHYINTPFDLSKVLFLCTCNDLNSIDRPLLDRMEIIELSGYTVEEKVHIAMTHLLPKQRRLHALADAEHHGAEDSHAAQDASGLADSDDAVAHEQVSRPSVPRLIMSKTAIADLITKWTMESGVRSLERHLAQVCRWAALRLSGPDCDSVSMSSNGTREEQAAEEDMLATCGPNAQGQLIVDSHHLPYIVRAQMFEPDLAERLTIGVAMGLAVTATGGQLLFVEATRSKGSGRLTVTGQLGSVMKESVTTAMSLLRSKIYYAILSSTGEVQPLVRVGSSSSSSSTSSPAASDDRSLRSLPTGAEAQSSKFHEVFHELLSHADATEDPFANDDVHVHFPAGAIPKDGPSAGVTTTLALASVLLNRPVRSDTAVTGEITLRGHVLPVGGIRDKVLAAHRAGIRHVVLPHANQRHVKDDIPASTLGDIELHYVKHIDEVLAWAFAENVKEWPAESRPQDVKAWHGPSTGPAPNSTAKGQTTSLRVSKL